MFETLQIVGRDMETNPDLRNQFTENNLLRVTLY
jgi:hypothetical protein